MYALTSSGMNLTNSDYWLRVLYYVASTILFINGEAAIVLGLLFIQDGWR